MAEDSRRPRRIRWNTSNLSLAAMVAGALVGWLLGPAGSVVAPVAKAYVLLLEMTVIPFLVLALVHGIGRLGAKQLKVLARVGVLVLLAVWALSLATAYAAAPALPDGNSSFYSEPEAAAPSESESLLELVIPANPFHALAEGVVPGIVFFTLLLAWQIARSEKKQRLVEGLEVAFQALDGIVGMITRLAPLGILALTIQAVSSGSDRLGAVSVYLLLALVNHALLTLWLLPVLVSSTTPISYSRLMKASFPAIAMAFLTSSSFVALPTLTRAAEELLAEADPADRDESAAEVASIVPIAFSLPSASSMQTILFLLFAAAAYDVPLDAHDHLQLLTTGVLSLFSGGVTAVTFLLDILQVPHDAIGLFLSTAPVLYRFKQALAVVSFLTVALLIHFGAHSGLRIAPLRVLGLLGGTLLLYAGLCAAIGPRFPLPPGHAEYYAEQPDPPGALPLEEAREVPAVTSPPSGLERLRAGQPLRIGLEVGRLPYCYTNREGRLTGYHVELATILGGDLGGRVEWIATSPSRFEDDLREGRVDVVLAPVQITSERLVRVGFSQPWRTVRQVLVAPDARSEEMARRLARDDWAGVTVGAYASAAPRLAPELFPGATVRTVDRLDPLLEGGVDAVLCTDIEAASWEVTHPAYDGLALPAAPVSALAYPVRLEDAAMRAFMDSWLDLQEARGTLDRSFEHWILGRGR